MVYLCIKAAAAAVELIEVSFKLKRSVNKIIIVCAVAPIALYEHIAFYKEIVVCIIHFDSAVCCVIYRLSLFILAYGLESVVLSYGYTSVI